MPVHKIPRDGYDVGLQCVHADDCLANQIVGASAAPVKIADLSDGQSFRRGWKKGQNYVVGGYFEIESAGLTTIFALRV